ncbi:MAG: class I SAM-dependent methyltransferase [Oscillospiraceae bacterium]|jgi:23S rRNA (cytosine1962-C5)-methyltransferase|nr:class I SAM-dependent methyltransferase [Oscillospiraceae bacterium]
MRISSTWQDYELIDTSNGERLERWGSHVLIRPDPVVVWTNENLSPRWASAEARYIRSAKGGGHWEYFRDVPQQWRVAYKDLTFKVKPTGFKHTGLFPEQAVNWDTAAELLKQRNHANLLNLFAYTGGATLSAASVGTNVSVTHVDAAKGMVQWAKENAVLSKIDGNVRYITDDAKKFIAREIRRGVKYDAVILDPPSYGRGPTGEMWKLEDELYSLMKLVAESLSDKPLFVMLNGYTAGLSPSVMKCLMQTVFGGADITADEIGLPVTHTGLVLPAGNTAIVKFE